MITFRESSPVSDTVMPSVNKDPTAPTASVASNFVPEGEESGAVLAGLGIAESPDQLPSEMQSDIETIKDFVVDTLKSKGLNMDSTSYTRVLTDLKEQLDLEPNTHHSIVIDRLAGVIKGYRNLVFIKDPKERKTLFMKLARLPDSKSMNKMVYSEMEKRSVWQ